jgi:fumarate hydratase class I
LKFPLKDRGEIEKLRTGDEVWINGIVVTSRDMAHQYYVEKGRDDKELFEKLTPYLKNGALYHCGPIVDLKENKVLSAGPTTSIREEPYEAKVMDLFGISALIGKGGMGVKTQEALVKYRGLYLHAVGGAGSFYAEKIKVLDVFKLEEFGMPEAIWVLEVKDFYTRVTMDFHGDSLHEKVAEKSGLKIKSLMKDLKKM